MGSNVGNMVYRWLAALVSVSSVAFGGTAYEVRFWIRGGGGLPTHTAYGVAYTSAADIVSKMQADGWVKSEETYSTSNLGYHRWTCGFAMPGTNFHWDGRMTSDGVGTVLCNDNRKMYIMYPNWYYPGKTFTEMLNYPLQMCYNCFACDTINHGSGFVSWQPYVYACNSDVIPLWAWGNPPTGVKHIEPVFSSDSTHFTGFTMETLPSMYPDGAIQSGTGVNGSVQFDANTPPHWVWTPGMEPPTEGTGSSSADAAAIVASVATVKSSLDSLNGKIDGLTAANTADNASLKSAVDAVKAQAVADAAAARTAAAASATAIQNSVTAAAASAAADAAFNRAAISAAASAAALDAANTRTALASELASVRSQAASDAAAARSAASAAAAAQTAALDALRAAQAAAAAQAVADAAAANSQAVADAAAARVILNDVVSEIIDGKAVYVAGNSSLLASLTASKLSASADADKIVTAVNANKVDPVDLSGVIGAVHGVRDSVDAVKDLISNPADGELTPYTFTPVVPVGPFVPYAVPASSDVGANDGFMSSYMGSLMGFESVFTGLQNKVVDLGNTLLGSWKNIGSEPYANIVFQLRDYRAEWDLTTFNNFWLRIRPIEVVCLWVIFLIAIMRLIGSAFGGE